MAAFRSMPIFRGVNLGIFTMGEDAVRLTEAMRAVWLKHPDLHASIHPAAIALGDPFNRERRERSLALLEALPSRVQGKILAAYGRKQDAAASTQIDRSVAA